MAQPVETSHFAGLVDLASPRLGAEALLASDQFFAAMENLIRPQAAVFEANRYTEAGKWMDGWETRRRRAPGHDWCLIRLGLPGAVRVLDIDTSHFLGNSPSHASLDAWAGDPDTPVEDLVAGSRGWIEVLKRAPLKPGAHNLFASDCTDRVSHVRLNIYPDGGVARLRVYGEVLPDWSRLEGSDLIDLVALENGGLAVAASDMFFGSMNHLILPGRAANMGEGWETRRRRREGHDWVILKAARPGVPRKIEVDTSHFKGNHPGRCSLETCHEPDAVVDAVSAPGIEWKEILPPTPLEADSVCVFEQELLPAGAVTHLRCSIYPDGGISRIRVWGTLA